MRLYTITRELVPSKPVLFTNAGHEEDAEPCTPLRFFEFSRSLTLHQASGTLFSTFRFLAGFLRQLTSASKRSASAMGFTRPPSSLPLMTTKLYLPGPSPLSAPLSGVESERLTPRRKLLFVDMSFLPKWIAPHPRSTTSSTLNQIRMTTKAPRSAFLRMSSRRSRS